MSLPLTAIFALILGIVSLFMANFLRISSRNMNYINRVDRVLRLAESGLNDALGRLAIEGSTTNINGIQYPGGDEGGVYENFAQIISNPITGGYYIVTSATTTHNGKSFSCKLHTYARISNVGDFFAALSNTLLIAPGVNASGGKVYAPNITFITEPGKQTQVLGAEYVDSCVARDKDTGVETPAPWDGTIVPGLINILTPVSGQPIKQNTQLQFPQLFDSDILEYKNKAGPHTTKKDFTGDIFPPGYKSPGCIPIGGDTYTGHTCDNNHHIYYHEEDMRIEGTIHGQILFVSGKDIYISSSLVSLNLDTPPPASPSFPGNGHESSSTAHAAILITRGNVYIDNTFHPGPLPPPTISTQVIQALIFAPNGALVTKNYGDDLIHDQLSLDFTGSMILQNLSTPPENLGTVFKYNRSYGYMESLRTHPPPYLPIVSEIYYSLEEITHSF